VTETARDPKEQPVSPDNTPEATPEPVKQVAKQERAVPQPTPVGECRRSESIAKLATALAIAQGQIESARKDKANTFFDSTYADLDSVWTACRAALSKNGLAVIQIPRSLRGAIEVETILAHSSGEWIADTLRLPAVMTDKRGNERFDPQSCGSSLTYARRYALAAFVGISQADDDANAATDRLAQEDTSAAPSGLNTADTKKLTAWVAGLEKDVTTLDGAAIALGQYYEMPKGQLKSMCWKALAEHCKQQGWHFSSKASSNGGAFVAA
jgi:hypothetical protein